MDVGGGCCPSANVGVCAVQVPGSHLTPHRTVSCAVIETEQRATKSRCFRKGLPRLDSAAVVPKHCRGSLTGVSLRPALCCGACAPHLSAQPPPLRSPALPPTPLLSLTSPPPMPSVHPCPRRTHAACLQLECANFAPMVLLPVGGVSVNRRVSPEYQLFAYLYLTFMASPAMSWFMVVAPLTGETSGSGSGSGSGTGLFLGLRVLFCAFGGKLGHRGGQPQRAGRLHEPPRAPWAPHAPCCRVTP